ncbi:MAG: glycoside hydrolase family 78 protein [Deinococcota bacterium]
MTKIINPTCEYRHNPLGIDIQAPRLSWQLEASRHGVKQTAYQVQAASDASLLSDDQADLWDSGKLETDRSVHVPYAGQHLTSRQRVYWQVTVWDEQGEAAQSDVAWFEMGLLEPTDWQANWISAQLSGGARSSVPVPHLRTTFEVSKPLAKARLYASALGLYECAINGQVVGEDVFAPGWTDYNKQVRYQVYDVTSHLTQGQNCLGAMLGDGWAAGFVGIGNRQVYVDKAQFLGQLELTYVDGEREVIVTDETWRHQFGPILESDLLMGEHYDARLELLGWHTPDYDATGWLPVETHQQPQLELVASNAPMIQRMAELKPTAPIQTRQDLFNKRDIVDLGQNMVGRVRLQGAAPRGTTVILRFAEVLDDDGNLYTDNLRGATATDVYTFKGEGTEVWESTFTFHGFRYVELRDYPGEVTADTVTGVVLYSAMPVTGHFECSDQLLNQLQHNILWGQRGNFLDVPTDCPQRDERLGWTGDIQVFARTAAFNMNIAPFLTKWAKDVRDAQSEAGSIPAVVPNEGIRLPDGGPAWADAAVICPWTVYLCYGDMGILKDNYDVMQRFMDFIIQESPGYVRCAPDYDGWMGFGDWLSINADTPRDLIGTAFLAYDASLMAKIAEILGKSDDAARYNELFEAVKRVFQQRFLVNGTLTADDISAIKAQQNAVAADTISRGNLEQRDYGEISSQVYNTDLFTPTQTAYVLGLHFDLLPEDMKAHAAQELVDDIARRDNHLSTGFVGSPYLPHVLSEAGQLEAAYDLLKQQTWPSWLYAVTQGATTIWERWDGWTEERGFQSEQMNSFNHYAYGAIGAWLYQVVAGLELDPAQPGYKHSVIQPQPGGGLSYAKASLETPYGMLSSHWEKTGEGLAVKLTIPANTTASVRIPGSRLQADESTSKLVMNLQQEAGTVSFELSSGEYSFQVV